MSGHGRQADRAAVVTGAGSGLGRAIAIRLAAEGAGILAIDIDVEAARATATSITAAGGRAVAHGADVRDRAAVDDAVAAGLRTFGDLHILVSNAGVFGESVSFLHLDDSDWDRVMSVNVQGAYTVARAVLPHLVAAGGGSAVFVSSTAAHVVGGGGAAYTTSKHALLGLARHLAVDLAADKVRVNAVCPGAVNTALTRPIWDEHPDALLRYSAVPAGRIGEPHEIAALVAFLVSEEASFLYGAGVVIDGGLTLT